MKHNTDILMCPTCKTYMSHAKNFEDGEHGSPRNDDFSICANCAEILCFVITPEVTAYRKATQADILRAKKDDTYTHVMAARAYILSGNHSFRNMTKEEVDLMNQKDNW